MLRQLDRLVWHEAASIWGPTTRLFRSIGRDPYIPRLVIDTGRYVPTGRVRVVDYPDPYPDRSQKVVTVEEFGRRGRGALVPWSPRSPPRPSEPAPPRRRLRPPAT